MKIKFISILVLVCMILCLPLTSYALNGKGTEANPFRISTQEELLLLADFPECYFELENDIEFEGTWEPIAEFSGSLNGKGHTITVSSYMKKSNMGLFGNLTGIVKNLTINANEMVMAYSGDTNIGLFAGMCSGSIENCKATGTFEWTKAYSSTQYVGGICGKLSGTLKNSSSEFELFKIGSEYSPDVGGICGYTTGIIECCANMSKIFIGFACYGGISYYNSSSATITNCMNLEKSTYIGRVSSYAGITYSNSGTLTNCYSVGGNGSGYGIEHLGIGTMTNCFYDKTVLGNSYTSKGIPKSTLAMKMEMTYTDWDFDTIWGIDESEENPINDGYPYLKVFYENVKNPVTKSSLYALNGNLIIDTKISDSSDNYTLHIAFYDENNRLCDYLAIPNERQLRDVFVVYPDTKNAISAKIFTWYSTGNMEPVSTAETVIIER